MPDYYVCISYMNHCMHSLFIFSISQVATLDTRNLDVFGRILRSCCHGYVLVISVFLS